MLHASAACNGGDIQNFWEGGRTLYGGTYHFMGRLNNPLETTKGSTTKEFASLSVGEQKLLTKTSL